MCQNIGLSCLFVDRNKSYVCHGYGSAVLTPRKQNMTKLHFSKCHRRICPDRTGKDLTIIRTNSGRNIYRYYLCTMIFPLSID